MSTISTIINNVTDLAIATGDALQLRGFKEGGFVGQVPVKGPGADFDWEWGYPATGETNLSLSQTANTVSISSDTGDDAIIPSATTTQAGVMSAADKLKLDAVTGSNTGDNAPNSLYSSLVTNATHTGDATGATALTVVGINGTLLSTLSEGLLKTTAGVITSVPIAELPSFTGTLGIGDGGTGQTTAAGAINALLPAQAGNSGKVLSTNGTVASWIVSEGVGTVVDFSFVNTNGFSGSVATSTSAPALTLSVSVSGMLKGSGGALQAATVGVDYSQGTSGLVTGILKSTTATGVLEIAVVGDFPTLNQSTTGNAATATKLASAVTINGTSFDGSSNINIPLPAGSLTGSSLAVNITAAPGLLSAAGGSFGTAAFTAASAYAPAAGSATITTVGTVTVGTWNGTPVAVANGGTGSTTAKAAVTALTTVVDNSNTSITLADTDSGTIIQTTQSSAVTVTVPAGLAANFNVMIIQGGTGQITINGCNAYGDKNKTAGRYASAAVIRVAVNTYNLSGNLV